MVDREKFGDRHACFECGCKFYDMKRTPPMCPRCGTDVSKPPVASVPPALAADDEIIEEDDDAAPTLEDEELPIEDLDSTEEMSEEEMGEE